MKSAGTLEIKTDRLLLRRFRAEDARTVYENYGSDPLVNRYISYAPCSTPEDAERFIHTHLLRYAADPDFYGWAIELGGEVIGSVGLFNVDEDADSCELGYSLGSRWWGHGYATEAARAVIGFAFARMECHRVYASHHIDNAASGRVLEKCGMRREGVMRGAQRNADGSYSDLVLYAALSDDPRSYD